MRVQLLSRLIMILMFISLSSPGWTQQSKPEKKMDNLSGKIPGVEIDNIMNSSLEIAEGTEVIVSHIVAPANTTVPKHWHPGEEFIYVLEGSVVIWQKNKQDTHLKKGDIFKVTLKQIHTAKTLDEGVTILVFRVHEKGQPIRINVE